MDRVAINDPAAPMIRIINGLVCAGDGDPTNPNMQAFGYRGAMSVLARRRLAEGTPASERIEVYEHFQRLISHFHDESMTFRPLHFRQDLYILKEVLANRIQVDPPAQIDDVAPDFVADNPTDPYVNVPAIEARLIAVMEQIEHHALQILDLMPDRFET